MAKKEKQSCCDKFKTTIGGQALLEGILMRGPKKDAIVVRTPEGLTTEVSDRKLPTEGSIKTWPLIRGIFGFGGSMATGVKATMRSAELIPDETEDPSRFERWLEKKLGNEKFEKVVLSGAVVVGLGFSVLLFFILPMLVSGFLSRWIQQNLVLNLVEGLVRMTIFLVYMLLVSRMKDMRRTFGYHGAEHKSIRCYEAGLSLTVENVRTQTRLHPRCGTSFLLVVMVISILVFSVASSALLAVFPSLNAMRTTFVYKVLMMGFKLLLLPVVVSITYEINRWAGRHDNFFSRILTAPGLWMQKLTTVEPDDEMIEVAICALQQVLPEKEGDDLW